MNYATLIKKENELKALSESPEYWPKLEELKVMLSDFVHSPGNLKSLTTTGLLNICRMVGSYRPMPLHTFFIYAAKEVE